MAQISINGAMRPLNTGATIATLVTEVTGRALLATGQAADGARLGVAAARNAEIVPRSQWALTPVQEGDLVEIVTAVQGG